MKVDYQTLSPGLRRGLSVFFVLCALLIGVDWLVHHHGDYWWHAIFGFYGWYGFISCVVLVILAKGMRALLMRGEDYYD